MAFWEAVSAAKDRSTARIASRIIAVWDVTTYVGIDKHKKLQGRRAVEDRIVRRRDILSEYRNTAVDLSQLNRDLHPASREIKQERRPT